MTTTTTTTQDYYMTDLQLVKELLEQHFKDLVAAAGSLNAPLEREFRVIRAALRGEPVAQIAVAACERVLRYFELVGPSLPPGFDFWNSAIGLDVSRVLELYAKSDLILPKQAILILLDLPSEEFLATTDYAILDSLTGPEIGERPRIRLYRNINENGTRGVRVRKSDVEKIRQHSDTTPDSPVAVVVRSYRRTLTWRAGAQNDTLAQTARAYALEKNFRKQGEGDDFLKVAEVDPYDVLVSYSLSPRHISAWGKAQRRIR